MKLELFQGFIKVQQSRGGTCPVTVYEFIYPKKICRLLYFHKPLVAFIVRLLSNYLSRFFSAAYLSN
jgi:hypothetical protein